MSERWDEAAAELAEERRRAIAEGEILPALEDAPVMGIPFTPSKQHMTAWRVLDEWHTDGKAPWTRVQCGIGARWHDTGVEMRLKRRETGRWWIEVRPGRKYQNVMIVVPEDDESDAPAPSRWEIQCSECGRPTRRDPGFLDDAMLGALIEYRSRRTTDGSRAAGGWPPQLKWTLPNAQRSSMG